MMIIMLMRWMRWRMRWMVDLDNQFKLSNNCCFKGGRLKVRRRRSAKISNCFSLRSASLSLIGEIAVVVLLLLLLLLLSLLLLLFYCCFCCCCCWMKISISCFQSKVTGVQRVFIFCCCCVVVVLVFAVAVVVLLLF